MKRLLITLLLLLATPALAMEPIDFSKPLARMGVVTMGAGVAAAPATCTGASPTGCTFRETFDGANDCTTYGSNNCSVSSAWTSYYGSGATFNNGTSPMQGTYMLTLNTEYLSNTFTAAAEYYAALMFKFASSPTAERSIFDLRSDSTAQCAVRIGTDNKLLLSARGGAEVTYATALSTATKYCIKIRGTYVNGSADQCQFWINNAADCSTWTEIANRTDGTFSNATPFNGMFLFWPDVSNAYYDDIRVWTSDIHY